MKIRNICISNFKSYNEAGIVIKLSDVTGFIGSNSAGKSNILEALELFFHPVKLDSSVFHKKQTNIPICLDITFDGFASSDSLNAKIMSNSQKITLRRIYKWNPAREQAEPDKNLYLRERWDYCGSNPYMNPYGNFAAPDIKKYLKGSESESFREATGIPETSTVKEFSQSLIKFWEEVDCSSDIWRDHFRWNVIDDQAVPAPKALQDAVNAVVLPELSRLHISEPT
ncbi:MAG: ATP-binding protein, partial [Oscillospiraceae bacterium]|nr:ATP-binding protein [Oscillospiraceae bacterium]